MFIQLLEAFKSNLVPPTDPRKLPLGPKIPYYRSLVTRLDAANEYKKSHLVTKEVWQLIQEADFFYIAVRRKYIV